MAAGKVKRVIGLTGNSGSGKSRVAEYLAGKGAYIIDADEVSHSLCEPGQPGLAAVKQQFDPYFFNEDGSLNRRRMGNYVFAHKEELQKLEGILHPVIMEKVKEDVAAHDGLIVIDCAILVKTGMDKMVDEVWLVKADMDTKLNRICSRDNISYEQAVNRLRNQRSDDELIKYSDVVLVNNGSEQMLLEQVEEALGK